MIQSIHVTYTVPSSIKILYYVGFELISNDGKFKCRFTQITPMDARIKAFNYRKIVIYFNAAAHFITDHNN
jgi:hypothetical protein